MTTTSVSVWLLLPGVPSVPDVRLTDALLTSESPAPADSSVAEYVYDALPPTGSVAVSLSVLPLPLLQVALPLPEQTQEPLSSCAGNASVTVATAVLGPVGFVTSMM